MPYGQVTYGQVPYGQVSYGQVSYGQVTTCTKLSLLTTIAIQTVISVNFTRDFVPNPTSFFVLDTKNEARKVKTKRPPTLSAVRQEFLIKCRKLLY